jgi:hypothetical protein
MSTSLRLVLPSVVCVALLASGGQVRAQPGRPANPVRRVDVTRWALSHGRVDSVRSVGIQCPENPRGPWVRGISTNLPFAPPPPGRPLATVLDVIAAARNPHRVTLDLDATGSKPRNPQQPSLLVLRGAIIPSGLTLAVAEMRNPAARIRWQALVRFGEGNFYATVSIPAAGIRRGMELYTEAHLKAYTANSILYESPDLGTRVSPWSIEGGTTNLGVRAVAPPPAPRRQWAAVWRDVGWANPLELMLYEHKQEKIPEAQGGGVRIWVLARLPNSFEPPASRVFRVAVEARQHSMIFETTNNPFSFDLPVRPLPPGSTEKADGMVVVTAVASSWGFLAPFPPAAPSPFVQPISPEWRQLRRQSVGNETWHSNGCTLGDRITLYVDPGPAGRTIRGVIYVVESRRGPGGSKTKVQVPIGTVVIFVNFRTRTVSARFAVRDRRGRVLGGTIYEADGRIATRVSDAAIFPIERGFIVKGECTERGRPKPPEPDDVLIHKFKPFADAGRWTLEAGKSSDTGRWSGMIRTPRKRSPGLKWRELGPPAAGPAAGPGL